MAQDPSSSDPLAPGPPDQNVLSAGHLESLREALEGLPDEIRRCFLLRYDRGYGDQAIAILMKLPIERVRACLAQALQSLGLGSGGEVS